MFVAIIAVVVVVFHSNDELFWPRSALAFRMLQLEQFGLVLLAQHLVGLALCLVVVVRLVDLATLASSHIYPGRLGSTMTRIGASRLDAAVVDDTLARCRVAHHCVLAAAQIGGHVAEFGG